ncbi:hypothetical protein BH20CHL6_BH20CHL6_08180 [soil metagenome]
MKIHAALCGALTALLLSSIAGTASAAPVLSAATERYIIVLAPDRSTSGTTDASISPSPASATLWVAAVDARIDRLASRFRLRPELVFRHAIQGFAADLTGGQLRALRGDPGVLHIARDRPTRVDDRVEASGDASPTAVRTATLAEPQVPTGVRRVQAMTSSIARIDGVDDRVDVDVAIIDTGIQKRHPDLNVAGGYNCSTSTPTAYGDRYGHGTHVAGTVGALDDGAGVVGVAPGARVWGVKVFDDNGDGWASWFICGIDWVTAQRDPADPDRPLIEVANMSLRGSLEPYNDRECGYPSGDLQHQAICRSIEAGTTYVVAAGNDSTDARYWRPAAYDEPITVSALADFDGAPGGVGLQGDVCPWYSSDADDTFANFSNYGHDIDLIAPGKCILSTYPGSTYAWMSGTSMAAPTVAGGAALYQALYPDARPQQVKQALRHTASFDWLTGTDPDRWDDPLLDVSQFAPPPDFSFTLEPPVGYLGVGSTLLLPLVITRTDGHEHPVTLSLLGAPAGFAVSSRPTGITGTTGTAILTGTADLVSGGHDLTVLASDGELVRSYPISVLADADPPTAHVSSPGDGSTALQAMTETTVDWSEADTGGSGVVSRSLQRQRGAIGQPGTCDDAVWEQDGAIVSNASPVTDSGLLSGNCYRWIVNLTDAAGNAGYATTGGVLVDTVAPAPPGVVATGENVHQPAANDPIYLRGDIEGSLTLAAHGSDGETGVASSTFGPLSASDGWAFDAVTVAGDPAVVTLSWAAGVVASSLAVQSTDQLGFTGDATTVTLMPDTDPPEPLAWTSVAIGVGTAGASATLRWDGGTDAGSGLAEAHLVQRQSGLPGPDGSCADALLAEDGPARLLTNGSVEDGLSSGYCYSWSITTLDAVGNAATPTVSDIMLMDADAPAIDFDSPDEGTLVVQSRTDATIAWTELETGGSGLASRSVQRQRGATVLPGSCEAVSWSDDGPAVTDASPVAAGDLLSDHCYRWLVQLTDAAGNSGNAVSGVVLVDTSAPTPPQVTATGEGVLQAAPDAPIFFDGDDAGSLILTAQGDDAGSGMAGSAFSSLSDATGWLFDPAAVAGDPPSVALAWSPGAASTTLTVTVTNGAGLTSEPRGVELLADSASPSITFPTPAAAFSWATDAPQIRWTESDEGSGVAETSRIVQRQRGAPAEPGSCAGVIFADDGLPLNVTSPFSEGGLSQSACYRWIVSVADRVGNRGYATSAPVLVDETPPTVGAPTLQLISGRRLGSGTVPVNVSWSGTDDGGMPLSYQVRRTSDGVTWTDVSLSRSAATSVIQNLARTVRYTFAVRARDAAGNWSDWMIANRLRPLLTESHYARVSYGGDWKKQALTDASGGSVHHARVRGARAILEFTGSSVSWISTLAPVRGRARIYVDGLYVRTIDLRRTTTVTRRVVFATSWAASGGHRLEIRVAGTAGRPRVDVDAFVVLSEG